MGHSIRKYVKYGYQEGLKAEGVAEEGGRVVRDGRHRLMALDYGRSVYDICYLKSSGTTTAEHIANLVSFHRKLFTPL